jgi:hypothetical protein
MNRRNDRRQLKMSVGRRVVELPATKRMKRDLREGGGDVATKVPRFVARALRSDAVYGVDYRQWPVANNAPA